MMEHFTAHLAEVWLTDEALARSSDPEMLQLWYWHALDRFEQRGGKRNPWRDAGVLTPDAPSPRQG